MPDSARLMSNLDDASDISRAFARYWLSLDKDGLIPRRQDFAPEQIQNLLPNMIIHEIVSPTELKMKLVGTAIVEAFGQEMTGRNYLDFVEEERRASASQAIRLVCEQPCGMLVRVKVLSKTGMALTRETVAFPMRDDDGAAKFVYFCSTPHARTGSSRETEETLVDEITERRYLDIGAGVPPAQE